jgi:hypothetical protein
MTKVTLSGGGLSTTLLSIDVPDRPLCSVGLSLLEGALKRAEKALRNVNLSTAEVTQREQEREALAKMFSQGGTLLDLGVPLHLIPTLRCALALHYHSAVSVQEEQQDLAIDTEETDARVAQLGRLLSRIDVEGLGKETTE